MVRLRFGPPGKTVAIIGPDGAGKSTLIDRLERELPLPLTRIYMGVNPSASTHALPTTRLIWFLNRRLNRSRPNYDLPAQTEVTKVERKQSFPKQLLRELKSFLFVANRVSEQWYRQWVCWYHQWRGHLVLLDRHFYLDYMAVKLSSPSDRSVLAWRVHDFLMERTYPRPHLTLYLDAPPEVLYARKQEVSIGRLEVMRQAYTQLKSYVPSFEILDATMTADQVFETAKQKITAMLE